MLLCGLHAGRKRRGKGRKQEARKQKKSALLYRAREEKIGVFCARRSRYSLWYHTNNVRAREGKEDGRGRQGGREEEKKGRE